MTIERIIGDAHLIFGDCREILPLLKADAVVTDHSYGIDFDYATKRIESAYRQPDLFLHPAE